MLKYLNYVKNSIKKTFSYSGRASRKEYIIFHLYELILGIIGSYTKGYIHNTNSLLLVIFALLFVFFALFSITFTHYALTIRRLHDCNLSGWWGILYFILTPGIFLILLVIKGNPDSNRYGEPPVE